MKIGRTVRAWLIGIAVAVVVAVGATELRPKGADPTLPASATVPPPAMALTVSVVHPERVEWPEVIQASGTITAWQEAIVGAEVAGLRLAELMVDVGDEVTKGQVLARFDDATTLAMVRQSEAAVAEAGSKRRRSRGQRATRRAARQNRCTQPAGRHAVSDARPHGEGATRVGECTAAQPETRARVHARRRAGRRRDLFA